MRYDGRRGWAKPSLTYNGYFYKAYWFVSPYDAIAWSETQWNLMGLR